MANFKFDEIFIAFPCIFAKFNGRASFQLYGNLWKAFFVRDRITIHLLSFGLFFHFFQILEQFLFVLHEVINQKGNCFFELRVFIFNEFVGFLLHAGRCYTPRFVNLFCFFTFRINFSWFPLFSVLFQEIKHLFFATNFVNKHANIVKDFVKLSRELILLVNHVLFFILVGIHFIKERLAVWDYLFESLFIPFQLLVLWWALFRRIVTIFFSCFGLTAHPCYKFLYNCLFLLEIYRLPFSRSVWIKSWKCALML